jgi:hypothetical protein
VFYHLTPAQCEQFVIVLSPKMLEGARSFLMIADFDKYSTCLDNADRLSLKNILRWQTRKALLPVEAAYLLIWHCFRPFMDLRRVENRSSAILSKRTGWVVPSQNLMPDILMMQPAKDGNCRDVAHR